MISVFASSNNEEGLLKSLGPHRLLDTCDQCGISSDVFGSPQIAGKSELFGNIIPYGESFTIGKPEILKQAEEK